MKETVAPKKLGAVRGILLVLALAAVLVLLNELVINLLARLIGAMAAIIAFWVLGGLLAWFVLRRFVVKFIYELGADALRLSRSYGRRERFIEDIFLNRVSFVGNPEEAVKRHPNARKVKAHRPSDKRPVTAIVYRDSKEEKIALIQASDALREKLIAETKRKR